MASLRKYRFVVTGAAGSIGSHLCYTIVKANARRLTMVSLTEGGLYDIERLLRAIDSCTQITGVLGSVCDKGLMLDACLNADVIIHAAAHKHVPICEANPLAAINNNIRGTLTAASVAEELGIKHFVFVSTDKAVKPKSVMGATKRVAEMIVSDKAEKSSKTNFYTVRFGNVLDSAGSVLPLWREQIAKGGPITITDKRCERYFMSIPDACELIFGVLDMKRPGTFVFDMGKPKALIDIARKLVADSGKTCAVKSIGLRPGEKLTEELHFGGEIEKTDHPKILRVSDGPKNPRMTLLGDLFGAVDCRKEKDALNYLWEIISELKLFCLGFPKSGTCTIQSVLETAGFRVAHTGSVNGYVGALLDEDHRKAIDPMSRLHYDAIVHPSVCDPKNGLNYWPQMDSDLLLSIRDKHPEAIFCLNTRPVGKLVRSISNWKDQKQRYTDSDIPGLPPGKGSEKELIKWIEWHYAKMRALFKNDPRFIEIDIENAKQSKERLSQALGITIKEWPCLNQNTNLQKKS